MSLTVALLVVFVCQVLFLVGYGLARPWWKSWEGTALVVSSAGWAIVAGAFLVDWHMEDVPDGLWATAATVAAVAALLKLWILVQSRRPRPAKHRRSSRTN